MERQIKRQKGPVEILCNEIGVEFDKRMEKISVLTAFVGVLVGEIESMAFLDRAIEDIGGRRVSPRSIDSIEQFKEMLVLSERAALVTAAAELHTTTETHDSAPSDRYLEMLSSCASAIRFGLEQPCRSRHAADAAHYVWKQQYGVTLFDSLSSGWSKEWARNKFHEALCTLLN